MTAEKILIVDDTAANIHLLAGVLEPRGYEILAASNAEQGLRIAAQTLPDLILLDVDPAGAGRVSRCAGRSRTKEATRAIPVLFVTAKDETECLLRGFRCGAVDYISKPFQSEEVLVRVETHLQLARLTREVIARNRELEDGDRPAAGSGSGAAHGDRAAGHALRAGHEAVGDLRIRRRQPVHAADPGGHREAAPVLRNQRADHRRERHRQGAGGARDPLQQPAGAGGRSFR